jgi:transcriptional regulator with XRE-family HTH domain
VEADSVDFAKRLRAIRKKAKISQYELAKRAGLTKQALSLLELGRRAPSWATVQAIAKALGVSCEAFADFAAESPAPRSRRPTRPRKP